MGEGGGGGGGVTFVVLVADVALPVGGVDECDEGVDVGAATSATCYAVCLDQWKLLRGGVEGGGGL